MRARVRVCLYGIEKGVYKIILLGPEVKKCLEFYPQICN